MPNNVNFTVPGATFVGSTEEQSDGSQAGNVRLLPRSVIKTVTLTRPNNTTPAYAANQAIVGGASALIQFASVGAANALYYVRELMAWSSDEASQQQLRLFWFDSNAVSVASLADKALVYLEEADIDNSYLHTDCQVFSRLDPTAHTTGASYSRADFFKSIKLDANGHAWALPVNMTASYTPLALGFYKFKVTFERA